MKEPMLISAKSKGSGGGFKFFLFFLILLVAFALGIFVGTKISNLNIKIVKKETKISNSQTGIQRDVGELKPLSTPEPKTNEYTLQIAAIKDMEEARKVVNELKEKGYYAYIVPIYNSRGEAWNLIRMGKFETREEAQDFATLFQEREGKEAFVKEIDQDTLLKEFGD